MFLTSAQTSAARALAASSVQPEGAAVVSGQPGEGLFTRLTSIASGFIKRAAVTTADMLKPSSLAVPGGSSAINAAAKASDAGSAVVKAGAGALASAGQGIKTGFTLGIAGIVVLAFLFLRHNLK